MISEPRTASGAMEAKGAYAQSPLVIGYNASSKFAAELKAKPWYQVLREPGIRIGLTNPQFDPKATLTLTLLKRAETFYNSPGLSEKMIGRPTVPEDLEAALLQSVALDVGFFYSTETTDAKIPALSLPSEITPKVVFTVTILHRAPNPEGADKFVASGNCLRSTALRHRRWASRGMRVPGRKTSEQWWTILCEVPH